MPLSKGRTRDDYELVELKGKHGVINLMVPTEPPTQEEIDEAYKALAEVIIDNHKRKKKSNL
ncbi:hypothetical protein [Oceanobacillus indicireducens]|uniref:Uncharacterized protein n=1 Tax=Oceanobacillus indicireducens TaxID=1004261 RepID=A0A917XVZ5_9BACI|nr:hypothetical protein [Oceanobacillus indicireducens]GGN56252.1 hypothetical protein GCM10007971_15890 [Oceanobacillus indicireducens]